MTWVIIRSKLKRKLESFWQKTRSLLHFQVQDLMVSIVDRVWRLTFGTSVLGPISLTIAISTSFLPKIRSKMRSKFRVGILYLDFRLGHQVSLHQTSTWYLLSKTFTHKTWRWSLLGLYLTYNQQCTITIRDIEKYQCMGGLEERMKIVCYEKNTWV